MSVCVCVSDTFHIQSSECLPLSEQIWSQTGGNPFFLQQLLHAYHEQGLIHFDYHQGRWKWELTKLHLTQLNDLTSVVDLLGIRVKQLRSELQEILKKAACLGHRFSLSILCVLLQQDDKSATAREIWPLVQMGLLVTLEKASDIFRLAASNEKLIPPSLEIEHKGMIKQQHEEVQQQKQQRAMEEQQQEEQQQQTCICSSLPSSDICFRFLHDSVQQASYQLMDSSEGQHKHLLIGRLLLNHCGENEKELSSHLLDIVDQFAEASSLLIHECDAAEVIQVIELCVKAAKQAKEVTAYQPAQRYLEVAFGLLKHMNKRENRTHEEGGREGEESKIIIMEEEGRDNNKREDSCIGNDEDKSSSSSSSINDNDNVNISSSIWHQYYSLCLAVCIALAEICYMVSELSRCEDIVLAALPHANNVEDRVKLLRVKFISLTLCADDNDRCIEVGQQILHELHAPLLDVDDPRALAVLSRDPADLLTLPEMTDTHQLFLMQHMQEMHVPIYLTEDPQLYTQLVLTSMHYSFEQVRFHMG